MIRNIGLIFLGLTLVFIALGVWGPGSATGPPAKLDAAWYTPMTARAAVLEHKSLVGNCFICHMGLVPDPEVIQPRFVHKKIQLDHGTNKRCFNCHWIRDRNYFTPDQGFGIVHRQVELLCSRCHGPVFKDWQAGTHGLKHGKWQAPDVYNTRTFTCTQCHDPHKPAFHYEAMAPPPAWPAKFKRPHGLTPVTDTKEVL